MIFKHGLFTMGKKVYGNMGWQSEGENSKK